MIFLTQIAFHTAEMTSNYAAQKRTNDLETDCKDIAQFFRLLLLNIYNQVSSENDYRSSSEDTVASVVTGHAEKKFKWQKKDDLNQDQKFTIVNISHYLIIHVTT
ncbi:hypothetical protein AVEN_172667-1 [Araneus ventricosus]|uniref:Uncharacterized protein n=1 Tax=Araneus ventricosus TaxID=182803 RepID=A0A4Y2HKG7_ARAVE|nr:hypothetical protein AVEN_172667-1 [Araneus ventricosus]